MWRDAVKSRLQAERLRWYDARTTLEERDEVGANVQILSVTRLLRLLDSDLSSAELADQHGITRYDVSPVSSKKPCQSLKRPRAEERAAEGKRATSYTSSCVWITGFLRHDQAQARKTGAGLCLSDAICQISVHIIDPALEMLDGLILVKSWTVIDQHIGTLAKTQRLLEVLCEPLLLHQPESSQSLRYEDALETLQLQYPLQDPPLYAGSKPWEVARTDLNTNTLAVSHSGKPSKRKTHAVLGRISSISPISVQADSSNSHYFVEVEDLSSSNGKQSLVNVLLAGGNTIRWYAFLWPGLLVLVTNLKKVYYAESEMFLLQASCGDHVHVGQSSLFVWKMPDEIFQPSHNNLSRFSDANACADGATFEVEGVVNAINWDECLVVDSHPPTLVALFHYPWAHLKTSIRVGCRVRIHQAHTLNQRLSNNSRVVVGVCSRSHIRILEHAPAMSPPFKYRTGDQRRRLRKKWSIFGDFSRQSLVISTWWLELLENLAQKFDFSSDISEKPNVRSISFNCTGRREATLQIGQDLLSASRQSVQSTLSTLGRRFLNSHLDSPQDCLSIAHVTEPKTFTTSRVPTLHNLELIIRKLAMEIIAAAATRDETLRWPIHIEKDAIANLVAVGALRGCADAGDLEITDHSATLPVILGRDASSVSVDAGCAVYAFRDFGAIIEKRENKSEDGKMSDDELVVTLTVAAKNLQRTSFCSGCSTLTYTELVSEKRCDLVMFITEIDAWKRRGKMRTMVSEFRSVRGLGFRQAKKPSDNSIDWSSPHQVEMLIDIASECWFIQKLSWLRIQRARVNSSVQLTTSSDCTLVFLWRNTVSDTGIGMSGASSTGEASQKTLKEQEPAEFGTYIVDSSSSIVPMVAPIPKHAFVEGAVFGPLDDILHQCVISLQEHAQDMLKVSRVCDLFKLDPPSDASRTEHAIVSETSRSDPHSARLINLHGVVMERTLYTRAHVPRTNQHSSSLYGSGGDKVKAVKRSRMCRLKIRDTQSLETVFVTFDQDAFGLQSALQPSVVVEIAGIQCFIARTTFKPFLTWTHRTTARSVQSSDGIVSLDGRLFTEMEDSYLGRLYKTTGIDRTIKRFVVRLAHLSYVFLKRRCSQCKQPLSLIKRQETWIHESAQGEVVTSSTQQSCTWRQIRQDSPEFSRKTFLASSLRCIVDDGSAQAELFLENDVVWELLRCSRGQRKRFEDLLVRQTSELSYFAARSAGDSLFTSPSAQENLYYQNEWRAFILSTIESLGSLVVFAQRFYKNQAAKPPQLSVLSFGKDIQITIPSVPLAQLEAVRVDELDARHELRRRLRSCQK